MTFPGTMRSRPANGGGSPTPYAVDGTGLAAAIAVCAACWWWVIVPGRQAAARDETLRKETAAANDEFARLGRLRDRLETEAGRIDAARDRLDAALPVCREEAETLQSLAAAASRAGLTLRQLTPRPPAGDDRLSVVTARLEGAGPFEGVVTFLRRLENMPRAARVSRLDVTSDEDGLRFALDLVLYRRTVVETSDAEGRDA